MTAKPNHHVKNTKSFLTLYLFFLFILFFLNFILPCRIWSEQDLFFYFFFHFYKPEQHSEYKNKMYFCLSRELRREECNVFVWSLLLLDRRWRSNFQLDLLFFLFFFLYMNNINNLWIVMNCLEARGQLTWSNLYFLYPLHLKGSLM